MYIVAIAWVYVALMMAITEQSVIAGVMTFLFYGLAPLALFLWIFGTPARRRAAARRPENDDCASVGVPVDQVVDQHDAADTGRDQEHLLHRGTDFGAPVQSGNEIGHGDVDHAGRADAQQVGHGDRHL